MLKQIINSVFGNRQPAPGTVPPQQQQAAAAPAKPVPSRDLHASFNKLVETATAATAEASRDSLNTLRGDGLVLTQDMKKRIYLDAPVLAPLVPEVQDALSLKDALATGDAAALQGLLARGVDFDGGMAYGAQPAIIAAAQGGNVGVIGLLLAHGASLNTKIKDDSSTLPLNQAALHGRREAFILLLDAGAKPHHMWSNGDGLWTVNGMAKKCKTDPGMADFVRDVIEARETKDAPDVAVVKTINIRRPIALKK